MAPEILGPDRAPSVAAATIQPVQTAVDTAASPNTNNVNSWWGTVWNFYLPIDAQDIYTYAAQFNVDTNGRFTLFLYSSEEYGVGGNGWYLVDQITGVLSLGTNPAPYLSFPPASGIETYRNDGNPSVDYTKNINVDYTWSIQPYGTNGAWEFSNNRFDYPFNDFVFSSGPLSGATGIRVTVPSVDFNFSVEDTTTNTSLPTNGTPYSGPVPGLQWEYIYSGSDNINVTADVPNVFIHTGSGEDAINVSHANGNNVLDGSTGSNFLVGGSGNDTFFVDDRGPSSDIWSTVSNFHAGDAATIFGITQQGFDTSWVDGQGATGYTGLTLHVTGSGHPTASLTLAGFSTADLSNGRISTTWGAEADGTPYLYVHANT